MRPFFLNKNKIKELTGEDIGATGDYPEGKLCASDEGGLKAALWVDHDHQRVHLDFGKELRWVSMTRAEAITFAEALRQKALKLIADG